MLAVGCGTIRVSLASRLIAAEVLQFRNIRDIWSKKTKKQKRKEHLRRRGCFHLRTQRNDRKGETLKAASYVFLFGSLCAIRGSLVANYSA